MSKRRSINDIVLLNNENVEPYFGRINARGAERADECPYCFLDDSHDPNCREWPNVEILDNNKQPTGGFVYHISECDLPGVAFYLCMVGIFVVLDLLHANPMPENISVMPFLIAVVSNDILFERCKGIRLTMKDRCIKLR